MVEHNERSSLDRRVTHIERITEKLDTTVSDLRAGQAALASQISGVVTSLDTITNRLNDPASKTSWTAIISAAVAILVLLGAIGQATISPMQKSIDMLIQISLKEAEEQSAIASSVKRHGEWLTHLEKRIDDNRDKAIEGQVRSQRNEKKADGIVSFMSTHPEDYE